MFFPVKTEIKKIKDEPKKLKIAPSSPKNKPIIKEVNESLEWVPQRS